MKAIPRAVRIHATAAMCAALFGAAAPAAPSALQAAAVREIHVRLSVGAGGPESARFLSFRPEGARLEVKGQRTSPGNPPRERNPELSEDLLLIVAVNTRGAEVYRVSRPDPRLLRAETTDESGKLAVRKLYRESVEFWVALPDDPDLDKVLFFHPEWTGTAFNLVPVGEVELR